MSYLDPRGGYASSPGDRSSGPDVPPPYAYGVPGGDESDPYADYRRPASLEDIESATTSPGTGAHQPGAGGAAGGGGQGAGPVPASRSGLERRDRREPGVAAGAGSDHR